MTSRKELQRHLALLQSPTAKTTPLDKLFDGKTCAARVVRCLDGDTIEVVLVLDSRLVSTKVRLAGIDAPELRPLKSDTNREEKKEAAQRAKEELESLLPTGAICFMTCGGHEKYGRLLATEIKVGRTLIIDEMVERGFAVRILDKKRADDWLATKDLMEQARASYNKRTIVVEKRKKRWYQRLFICGCFH